MLSVPLKLILGSCVYPDFYKNKDELSINDEEKKLSKSIRDRKRRHKETLNVKDKYIWEDSTKFLDCLRFSLQIFISELEIK